MANSLISPGIETKIIDLNSYLTSTSGTVGFVPIITEKGKDNELVRITSFQDYIDQFGEPDMRTFGKYYGCGPYIATQHLKVSSDLYVVRALPDDATYAHLFLYYSQVADYPYAYQFAKRYADQILDEKATYTITLYAVRNDTEQVQSGDKRQDAINAGAAYDADMEPTNIVNDVVYTSDTKFAKLDTYTALYDILVTDTEDKRQEAITAGKAYGSDWKLLPTTADKESAVFTSDAQYAEAGAVASHYAADGAITYQRVGTKEATGSEMDNNTGYKKNHNSWYTGKHTSISAFSVVPDMVYANQSDVTCYQHVNQKLTGYVIDPQYVETAFVRRVGFDDDGYLVLDDQTRITRTNRVEFAARTESGDTPILTDDVCVPSWTVDPEPWYVIDPTKVDAAIADYDAYDKYGFLTNVDTDAKYCGNVDYAKVNASTKQPVVETEMALRKPTTKKFVDTQSKMRFVMDRESTIEGKTFAQRAMIAMERFAAWDANGYPALSVDDVYVTSIESYATTSKTPKMNNTQKLDSFFYGLDTATLAAIKAQSGSAIYSDDSRMPCNCILGHVRAVGRGSYYNNYSVKITTDANPQNFGTYKFQIYEIQDGTEVIAESFNVSFDPESVDGDGESNYFVDVINKYSTRVVVEANENAVDLFKKSIKDFYQNDPTIADIAENETFTYDGFELPLVGTYPENVPTFNKDTGYIDNADLDTEVAEIKAVLEASAETDEERAFAESYSVGVKGHLIWEAYYAKAWAEKYTYDAAAAYSEAINLPDTDDTKTAKVASAIDMMTVAEDMSSDASSIYNWATAKNLMNMNDSDSITAGEQPYYLDNGSLGSLLNSKGLVDATIGNQILSWAYTGLLKNPVIKKLSTEDGSFRYKQQYTDNVYDGDWIYFSIVYDPGYKPDVKDSALELVSTYRDDCFLVSDCGDNADYEDCLKYTGYVQGGENVRSWNTFRAARFEPYSRVYDSYTGKDQWVSPVYHMAELFSKNDSQYGLQYANAGFNRAVISSIKELRYSPNKSQRDLLYLAQVNPIVYFPEGMTVWGNLTTQKKSSSLSNINSVRVVLYIKRALEQYCRNFIFENNDNTTWTSIHGNVASFLSDCKSNSIISGYEIEVGATEYELKTKTCHVDVTLTLNSVLEKIELNMSIQ